MNRQTILLVFGGESSEHDVSIMSARNVHAAIDKEKYDILLTYIDRKGHWWLLDDWREDLSDHRSSEITILPGTGSITVLGENKKILIDVVFPVMHGENGHEDGTLQGAFRLAHIPVIGSGIGASAVCWDKLYTKQILGRNHIKTTPYFVSRRGEPLPDYEQLTKESPEIFIKPTTAGSSVGVSKVHSVDEFKPAIDLALKNSNTVLIEQAIKGRELEVAVLGTPPNHRTSGVGEIIPGEEFYSYDDKYSADSRAQVITNADISDELRTELKNTAHKVFAILGCKGLARVDFLVSAAGDIYVNEVNTLPGFTSISQYPKLWEESGVSYSQLIDELIVDALG
jgi:D-alanine-D-alanine ligase